MLQFQNKWNWNRCGSEASWDMNLALLFNDLLSDVFAVTSLVVLYLIALNLISLAIEVSWCLNCVSMDMKKSIGIIRILDIRIFGCRLWLRIFISFRPAVRVSEFVSRPRICWFISRFRMSSSGLRDIRCHGSVSLVNTQPFF